jgi:alpha-galactosidase
MRDALNHTGRPIFYAACEWGELLPALWFNTIANSWRTTGDISDHWLSMLFNIDVNDLFAEFAAPYGRKSFFFFLRDLDLFFYLNRF